MKSVTKKQLAVLAGSSVVIVLLLFANTKLPDNKEVKSMPTAQSNTSAQSITTLVEESMGYLKPDQKAVIQKLEAATKVANDKSSAYEQLISACDSLHQPVISAFYAEQAAKVLPVEKNWIKAGDRYYAATRFSKEEERPFVYERAIACYEKGLELNPENTEAKISLASCYVEGSSNPMKGIGLLREVEKVDSNNVNLQLSFAFFSEKSGQWDKAIKRFEKALTINPELIDVYLHLADAYKQKGDIPNAIKSLEKYLSLVDDVVIKTEIQNYINKLKNS
jgi:tetratricopeptide (TPR) repeat protein